VTCCAVNLKYPLCNKYIGKNNECFCHKICKHETNGSDGLTEPHFIGNDSTTNFTKGAFGFTKGAFGFTKGAFGFTKGAFGFTKGAFGFTKGAFGFTN
jgi:hypothetical protein